MPWRDASPMDQRTQFIGEHLRGGRTITELCDDYGVSCKTGYKWIERYLRQGAAGQRGVRLTGNSPRQLQAEVQLGNIGGSIQW